MRRKGFVATLLFLPIIAAFSLLPNLIGKSSQTQSSAHQTEHIDPKTKKKLPPYYDNPDDVKDLPKVLDPDQFKDPNTKKAYQLAKDNPRLLMQLPCGCGCDVSDGHKSLLSCYTDKHGEFCGTCQQEALMAGELFAKGTPITEIRAKIVEKFIY
ncbi:MAG TPA: CYCXC family (seleno)protein [Blastocatellia bacterium]|nr:CYCXC family (seleno)protein [Blastocatellia bacterium]